MLNEKMLEIDAFWWEISKSINVEGYRMRRASAFGKLYGRKQTTFDSLKGHQCIRIVRRNLSTTINEYREDE